MKSVLITLTTIGILSCMLSGCIVAAAGAGAAGGYYFKKDYDVKVSKKNHAEQHADD